MKTSKSGINMIKSFEGLRLTAYKCVPTEKYYTIGYGHYGKDVKADAKITEDEAEKILIDDLPSYEKKVSKYDSVYHWTQNEYDALVSFAYNVGSIDQLTKKGERTKEQIAAAMLNYTKSGGVVLKGLVNRRKVERNYFLSVPMSEQTYSKYDGTSKNLDMILKSIGVPDKYIGSWTARRPLAEKNGISGYVGSAEQNCKIKLLAKNGQLKKI